jgi:hypothetical protein
MEFGIPESSACSLRLVSDIGLVAQIDGLDDLAGCHPLTVGPADPEIGFAIERVVERACEVKVFGNQRFGRGAILIDIGLKTRASEFGGGSGHGVLLSHSGVTHCPEARLQFVGQFTLPLLPNFGNFVQDVLSVYHFNATFFRRQAQGSIFRL